MGNFATLCGHLKNGTRRASNMLVVSAGISDTQNISNINASEWKMTRWNHSPRSFTQFLNSIRLPCCWCCTVFAMLPPLASLLFFIRLRKIWIDNISKRKTTR